MAGGVIRVAIHAEDDRHIGAACRRADDDLPRTRAQVRLGLARLTEFARRLEHDIDPEISPRQLGWVGFLQDPDPATVDDQLLIGVLDGPGIRAVRRVVFEQMRVRRSIGEVIDRDHLHGDLALEKRLERLAADPAESVDPHSHCHWIDSPIFPSGLCPSLCLTLGRDPEAGRQRP